MTEKGRGGGGKLNVGVMERSWLGPLIVFIREKLGMLRGNVVGSR